MTTLLARPQKDLGVEAIAAFVLVFLVLGIVTLKGFILEDAFIVFRSIRNFHDGFELSAIPDIRSQSFTSNLWTILLLLGGYLSKDFPNVAIILSLSLTFILAMLLFFYFLRGQTPWLAPLSIGLLACSNTFTDYSTSGLENPLSHTLLAIFLIYGLSKRVKQLDFFVLCFLASLIAFNRYDHVILVLPVITLIFLYRRSWWCDLWAGMLAFFPLWIWMTFAWFYFGSPFPDTYHAKINTGVPVLERAHFAILHHLRMFDTDFLGMIMVFLGMGWSIGRLWFLLTGPIHKEKYVSAELSSERICAAVLGVVLYNIYFLYAGGDYMIGRFVSVMIVVIVICFCLWLECNNVKFSVVLKIGIFFCALLGSKLFFAPNLFVPGHGEMSEDKLVRVMTFDQRRFSQNWYFISQDHLKKDWRRVGIDRAIDADQRRYPSIIEHNSAGIIPYYGGARAYIIDRLGLSDPLLSRLPCTVLGAAAHCERIVPEGYKKFLENRDATEMDANLAIYVDALFKIKTMPLLSLSRIKLLIYFSIGRFEAGRSSYILLNKANFYIPGTSNAMFRHAYSETILKPFFDMRKAGEYKHPWW